MSHRLQLILAIMIALVLFSLAVTIFSASRVIAQEYARAQYHFNEVIGNLRSHGAFLELLDGKAGKLKPLANKQAREILVRSDPGDGTARYEIKDVLSSTAFILATRSGLGEPRGKGILALGVALDEMYDNYWANSEFPGDQALVLSLRHTDAISKPCLPLVRAEGQDEHACTVSLARIRKAIIEAPEEQASQAVHWLSLYGEGNHRDTVSFMAYRRISVDPAFGLTTEGQPDDYVAASFVDSHRLSNVGGVLDRALVEGFELFSPDGTPLMPRMPQIASERGAIAPGVSYVLPGIIFQVSNADGWRANYFTPYKNILYIAQFHLIAAFILILIGAATFVVLFRHHSRMVVLPAQRSHERMVESESFSRAVVDSAQVGVCVIADNGEVLNANALARTWLGGTVTPELLTPGRTAQAPGGQPDGPRVEQLNVAGRNLQIQRTKTRYEGRDATLYVLNDITQFIDVANVLNQAKTAAESANVAKTVFLSTMSHEIRTPLYGVLGTLELLSHSSLDPEQRQCVQTIEKSSASLLHIISDVLDVAKIEAGQLTLDVATFDPVQLTEEVLQSYAALAHAKDLQIYALIDPAAPRAVQGDALRIRQVLSNLVSNALKFTEQGRVTLALQALDATVPASSARLRWRVVDTGVGISEEYLDSLFEPFFQVPSNRVALVHGTGIGLSICKSIVTMMGGHIDVKSQLGGGTAMTLALDLPLGSQAQAGTGNPALKPETILVRAPFRELANNICLWVEHWGARAVQPVPGRLPDNIAVVVDIFPDYLPQMDWEGPRIVCLGDGPSSPQASRNGRIVNLTPIQNVGWALHQLQSGERAPYENPPASRPGATPRAPGEANPDPRIIEEDLNRLSLRILVAEDNATNQALIQKQLKALGCKATIVNDGAEALSRWGRETFDILITDINMPVMDGLTLAARLRAAGEVRPIIGITATPLHAGQEREDSAISTWLTKPFTIAQLRDCLLAACVEVKTPLESRWFGSRATTPEEDSIFDDLQAVFVQTTREDLEGAKRALLQKDARALRAMMHRLCGSLGVAHFADVARDCWVLEEQLNDSTITMPVEIAVRSTIAEIEKILDQIQQPPAAGDVERPDATDSEPVQRRQP